MTNRTARDAAIRHWRLRNGHSPDPGYKVCLGCEHEMDDLFKALRDAGFAVVPVEPTEATQNKIVEIISDGITINDDAHRTARHVYRAMLKTSTEEQQDGGSTR